MIFYCHKILRHIYDEKSNSPGHGQTFGVGLHRMLRFIKFDDIAMWFSIHVSKRGRYLFVDLHSNGYHYFLLMLLDNLS